MLHPEEEPRLSHIESCLKDAIGPVIAATDYMKNYADQIREYVGSTYNVLGTDGFGRSDTREKLRNFFEVDRYFITVSALDALVKENVIDGTVVKEAIDKFGINPDKPDPSLL
jgi:pyruvate dehydrogenase E1 component